MTRWMMVAVLAFAAMGCGGREATVTTTATAPAPAPAPAQEPVATSDTVATAAAEAPEHDVTGAYFPMTSLPRDFAELDHLLLATIDENAAPAPLNGFLRPKARDAKDYVLVQPSMSGNDLTFTTAPVDGVHYTFTGAFGVLGKFAENPPDYETAVLTGTLTKMRGTVLVASTPVKFRYEAGG
jgi:hypothetical protein